MAIVQRLLHQSFINVQGRDFRGLKRRFVSRQGASLDAGTDVRQEITRHEVATQSIKALAYR
jgi:hypothetical protein